MGRTPCCNVDGLKKGAWTSAEDQKLTAYIQEHGEGGWRTLPQKAGLQRCGKSCRLRWANYLRPDIKRGEFSPEEEERIIHQHASLGNRWSAIARHLPKRTDNEIKNYWNTHLKKRLFEKGIHPTTHKPVGPTTTTSSDLSLSSTNAPPAQQRQPAPARRLPSSSASAQLLNSLAANLAPPASTRFNAQQEDGEGANGVVEDAPSKLRRRPASSSSSAKLLNKMASRLAHPLHGLNTLKSIISSASPAGTGNYGNFMHRCASTSSLSESTAATTPCRSISTSQNHLPAQTASSNHDLAFLESLDLNVLNDWQQQEDDTQPYDAADSSVPVIMDFLADSITSKEKEDQPSHYYDEDSLFPASQYGDGLTLLGSRALDSRTYFDDYGGTTFRGISEDQLFMDLGLDLDGPSTSSSRNNDQADDPHYGYGVDDQVVSATEDTYGHHPFEYQHGAGGLLDGDDEHGRTFFNNYADCRIDAPAFF